MRLATYSVHAYEVGMAENVFFTGSENSVIQTGFNSNTSLYELIHFYKFADIEENIDATVRKINFWCYELKDRVSLSLQPLTQLELVRDYLFIQKAFKASPEPYSSEQFLLSKSVQSRLAPPVVIGILFQALAKSIGLDLHFVRVKAGEILKFVESGQSHYLNLKNSGLYLEECEIIECLSDACKKTDSTNNEDFFSVLPKSEVLNHVLINLEPWLKTRGQEDQLLCAYNFLLELNDKQITTLAKRACLYFRRNLKKEAWQDVKRYYLICEPDRRPPEIVKLYHTLKIELEAEHALDERLPENHN